MNINKTNRAADNLYAIVLKNRFWKFLKAKKVNFSI